MRLSIRAVIRWEQLNQKPFSSRNYGDENDIVSLFYVCKLPDEAGMSLSEFKKNLTEDSLKEMAKEFEKQTLIASQFQPVSKKKIEKSKDSEPVYIKDLVSMLVMNGLDVHFALDEMEMYELSIFLHACEEKEKRKREFQRDGIFWMLRPHLTKRVREPQDLYLFHWEIEEKKEKTKEETEKGMSVFEVFMNSGKPKL
jgi:hypothetical protein